MKLSDAMRAVLLRVFDNSPCLITCKQANQHTLWALERRGLIEEGPLVNQGYAAIDPFVVYVITEKGMTLCRDYYWKKARGEA